MITVPFLFFTVLLCICVTIAACGKLINNDDMTVGGAVLFTIAVLLLFAWSYGAKWQREDILKKYNLTAKEVPA